jgi:hypothetical protein
MNSPFVDIELVRVDSDASVRTSPDSPMFNFRVLLSAKAPGEWSEIFNRLWVNNFYQMKRPAHANGRTLQIQCTLNELKAEHFPEFHKVIQATNDAYRAVFDAHHETLRRAEEQRAADRTALEDFNKQLKK